MFWPSQFWLIYAKSSDFQEPNMLKHFCLAASAISLIACSGEMDHSKMNHDTTAAENIGAVEVSSAFIKPPFTGRTTAAGFMVLENKGMDTRLVAAASPISPRVEIHTHLEEDGVMKMRRVDGIDLPKGKSVELKPGGYHLMLFDTVMPEGDADAPLTLTYSDGSEVTMIVPFADEAPDSYGSGTDHSKMGH